MNIFDILKNLLSVVGPSGSEKERSVIIRQMVKDYADEIFTDAMGNLYVHKKGNGNKIMIAAHMDTLGFIIDRIDENGFVKVFTVGGVQSYALNGARVKFTNGAVGTFQIEEKSKPREKCLGDLKITDFYVDIGARSRAEAEEMVKIGERGIYNTEPFMQFEKSVFSPYCDDLMGCATMIEAICNSKECLNDMYYVFTVQEEVGCRGAEVAANRVNPDIAIVVEATDAEDIMSYSEDLPRIIMGNGPVLREYDGRTIYDAKLNDCIKAISQKINVCCQVKFSASGSNDSSVIQKSNYGVRTACLSIPTKYMHTQLELQNINDVNGISSILQVIENENFSSVVTIKEEE